MESAEPSDQQASTATTNPFVLDLDEEDVITSGVAGGCADFVAELHVLHLHEGAGSPVHMRSRQSWNWGLHPGCRRQRGIVLSDSAHSI